ncbi:GGDEF domain-containing protein [Cellulomonas endophytica]|uniref:GGDEF domain-containing protein n=1 Tax=Cellulomonas endophytica TaxID=2494735 RepID=UPI001011656B|nr:GGDEF domain-containing protein [Cellulomonas endophytica]
MSTSFAVPAIKGQRTGEAAAGADTAGLQAVVAMAAAIAAVPTATINLFVGDLQCQPFTTGFVGAATALDESMCAVASRPATVVVADARSDPRYAGNAWVDGRRAHVRLYASTPLFAVAAAAEGPAGGSGTDGQGGAGPGSGVIGSLCVFDERPGDLRPSQVAQLELLARTAEALLAHRTQARHWQAVATQAEQRRVLLEAVLDSVDVAIVAADADGRLSLFNRTARQWHGIDADAAIDPSDLARAYDLFAEDGHTPLAKDDIPLLRALREGRVDDARLVIAPQQGRRRTVQASGRALRGTQGRSHGAVVAMADVTAAQQAAARDARLLAREQALVRAQGRVAAAELVPAVVMERICQGAQDVAGASGAALVELHDGNLLVQCTTGSLTMLQGIAMDPLESLSGWSLLADTPARAGTNQIPLSEVFEGGCTSASSLLAVPLHHEGRSVGALLVAGSAVVAPQSEEDAAALQLLAAPFAAAMSNAWAMQRAVRDAATDALTGLPNRSAGIMCLEQALARQDRHGGHLAVLFLDLNGFKQVNDRYGHRVGDDLLVAVAAQIRRTLRQGDTPARYGGDEFLVVAEGLSARQDGSLLAERLRQAVGEVTATLPAGSVHVAIGVAHAPEGSARTPRPLVDRATSLLVAADDAMYRDKRAGDVAAKESLPSSK